MNIINAQKNFSKNLFNRSLTLPYSLVNAIKKIIKSKKIDDDIDEKKFFEFMDRIKEMKKIIKADNIEKYNDLVSQDGYWPPEARGHNYISWVNENYSVDPNSAVSLKIYSLLSNMPMEQLRNKMSKVSGIEAKPINELENELFALDNILEDESKGKSM